MSTTAEKNTFRRLIGDYGKDSISEDTLESYLDDATLELTSDFTDSAGVITPVSDFDALVKQYHPEIILYAAINWWWNRASALADKHSQSVGDAEHKLSEKWERAIAMIKELEQRYAATQQLGTDITVGNFSRFSKKTLTRLGGRSEEAALNE